MKTTLAGFIRNTHEGEEAGAILQACVHCGYCTATCPTYQLLGNEFDGPRGRIYLIKQVLEGRAPTAKTQLHLDRCLACRTCETVCPSGVRYGRLLEIGRKVVEARVGRKPIDLVVRKALRMVIPNRAVFRGMFKLGQLLRPLLPRALKRRLPETLATGKAWPQRDHQRTMIVMDGCVQDTLSPATNVAAARVLDRLHIRPIREPTAGCCGALSYHLNAHEEAMDRARRNIDAWWSHVENGVQGIVIASSACGAMVKDYNRLLALDEAYAEKARRIAELALDISDVVATEKERLPVRLLRGAANAQRVAFHAPCTLQNALKCKGKVEALLLDLGFELQDIDDSHLCCGAAGTYSVLQPALSRQLLDRKIKALTRSDPRVILTANVGCQHHLRAATDLPVVHWVEALDEQLPSSD